MDPHRSRHLRTEPAVFYDVGWALLSDPKKDGTLEDKTSHEPQLEYWSEIPTTDSLVMGGLGQEVRCPDLLLS
jgi:hypothetical protein